MAKNKWVALMDVRLGKPVILLSKNEEGGNDARGSIVFEENENIFECIEDITETLTELAWDLQHQNQK